MSEDPHATRGDEASTDEEDEETLARRSRDTGGDAPAAASIEEREALADEGTDVAPDPGDTDEGS